MTGLREEIVASGLQPPRHLTLMVTANCNLRCVHCWLDCIAQPRPTPVPAASCRTVMEDFARLGGHGLTITGGEVLTHPQWRTILADACGTGAYDQVRLQTNATLLTAAVAADLKNARGQGLRIQVSLDGATAETHDSVRGTGSFHRTLRGLRHLAAAGLGEITEVAFTEMAHNFDELPGLLELAASLGIHRVIGGTLVRGGRAARCDGLNLPTPAQYERLLHRYHTDARFRQHYRQRGRISALEWYRGRSQATDAVCTCIGQPFIAADGRMFPCVMFLNEAYAGAGVYRTGVAQVIRSMLSRWAQLPRLEQRRWASLTECRECAGRTHCKGGCMGRADAAHGDPMTREDRCVLRRAVYHWQPDEGQG